MKIQQRMEEADRGVRAETFLCAFLQKQKKQQVFMIFDSTVDENHPHSHKALRSTQLRLSNSCQQIPPLASIA